MLNIFCEKNEVPPAGVDAPSSADAHEASGDGEVILDLCQ